MTNKLSQKPLWPLRHPRGQVPAPPAATIQLWRSCVYQVQDEVVADQFWICGKIGRRWASRCLCAAILVVDGGGGGGIT